MTYRLYWRHMKIISLPILFTLLLIAGCEDKTPPQATVGADRDQHGCIPSAGYMWCASTQQCERPWELAKQHSFENSSQGFDDFCSVQKAGIKM